MTKRHTQEARLSTSFVLSYFNFEMIFSDEDIKKIQNIIKNQPPVKHLTTSLQQYRISKLTIVLYNTIIKEFAWLCLTFVSSIPLTSICALKVVQDILLVKYQHTSNINSVSKLTINILCFYSQKRISKVLLAFFYNFI